MAKILEIKCSPVLNNNEKISKLKEVSQAVCALLNHRHGGSVVLFIDDQEGSARKGFKTKFMRTFLRGIEQRLRDRFGDTVYCSGAIERIEHSDCKVEILVESGKNVGIWLFTIETNLFSPGCEELHKVSSLELLQSILCRIVIWQTVSIRTHIKRFVKDTDSGLIECRTVQLKSLKANASQRTTLADRITSKGNKLNCYVSAFANRYGGHIYYGIDDDRVVKGEFIPSEKDMNDIAKKVEKVMKKMIWPEQIGQPTRGVHWEIFFEPVVDQTNELIPSTFVIVIYIAPCLGGVFTEEPESYEMVERKVEKMSLSDWKIRLFSSVRFTECIPSTMRRITWSNKAIEQTCTRIVNVAMESIDNGLYELSEVLEYEEKFPHVIDVKLTIISRQVMACLRRGYFEEAYSHLKKYNEILPHSEDVVIFEALLIFLLVCLRRAEGQLSKDWSLIKDLINKTVLLPAGPLTARIYAICTTVSPEEHSGLSITALCRKTLSQVRNGLLNRDIAQKVGIFGGLYDLGCDLSEGLSLKSHYKVNLKAAASPISLCEGQLTNCYRKAQYYILQAMKLVRCSQLNELGNKGSCLESARKYCLEAERIAINCQFYEMINLSKHAKSVCANESKQLVRVRSDGRTKN